MRRLRLSILAFVFGGAACATTPPSPDPDGLLAAIARDPELSALETALERSGLRGALAGPGPYTVFAPRDAAFAAHGAGLDEATPEQLRRLLERHVVRGRLSADDLATRSTLDPLQGQPLRIQTAEDKLVIEGAAVVMADTATNNGVLHVIDRVFPPAAKKDDKTGKTTGRKGGPDAWWW